MGFALILLVKILDVVTIGTQGPGAVRREVLLVFPNWRGRQSAARAGLISDVHRVSEDKGFPCRLARQGN